MAAPASKRPLLLVVVALMLAGRAASYEYQFGANMHWGPTAAATGDSGSVDAVLDGLQRVGARLVRTWAFNTGVPSAPGVYDQNQLRRVLFAQAGLDEFVAGAQRRGMRVILALGNFWASYKGPEEYLNWAKAQGGDGGTGTVLDFYTDPVARQLYKDHLSYMLGRTNGATGRAYASDPGIYAYDVINEPRCPGCDAAGLAAHMAWLSEMAAYLKGLVHSGALVLAGTEGFFTPQASGGNLVSQNPGAGAGCEGEDVAQVSALGPIGGLTAHLYWRHMEQMAALGWQKPGFDVYVNYLDRKLELLTSVAAGLGKPFIVEEFGLTQRFFDLEQRKVVFAIVLRRLVQAKREGKALAAALFWNAAHPGGADYGGYDVQVTRPPSGIKIGLMNDVTGGTGGESPAPGTNPSPSPSPSPGGGGGGGSPSSASSSHSHSPSPSPSPPSSGRRHLYGLPPPEEALPAAALAAAGAAGAALSPGRRLAQVVVTPGDDELDSFRRGPQRTACAEAAAGSWSFDFPGHRIDAGAWLKKVGPADIVDILREAADLLA